MVPESRKQKTRKQIHHIAIANTFDLTIAQARRLRPALTRCSDELAEQVLVNRVKRVKELHREPMAVGRGTSLIDTGDAITIAIRKQPRSESPDVIAVQRAGGLR